MYRNDTLIHRKRVFQLSATFLLTFCLGVSAASTSSAEISVGTLTKDVAKNKYGITMHARKNGDAGIKVWLEFKQEGWLEAFTYAELRMKDSRGKQLISAKLKPNYLRSKDVTTISFSSDAGQHKRCSFLVVCYNSDEGDAGYYLNVKDFLDTNIP